MLRGCRSVKMTKKIPYDYVCRPRPSEFLDEFQDRFGLVVAEGYGSTETNLVVTVKEITLHWLLWSGQPSF